MASVKKGQLVRPPGWAKHLHSYGVSRAFWHRERQAEDMDIQERLADNETDAAAEVSSKYLDSLQP